MANALLFLQIALRWRGEWLVRLIGEEATNILTFAIAFTVFIYRAPYRKWGFYKRIMGDKAKPYPYDGNGKRVYRWNGTPIEKPGEEAEPGTLEESEAADGELEEETK